MSSDVKLESHGHFPTIPNTTRCLILNKFLKIKSFLFHSVVFPFIKTMTPYAWASSISSSTSSLRRYGISHCFGDWRWRFLHVALNNNVASVDTGLHVRMLSHPLLWAPCPCVTCYNGFSAMDLLFLEPFPFQFPGKICFLQPFHAFLCWNVCHLGELSKSSTQDLQWE